MDNTYQKAMWLFFVVLVLATTYYTNGYIAIVVTLLSFIIYFRLIRKTPVKQAIPESVKKEVWERQGMKCPVTGITDLDLIDFHHIKPRREGGSSIDPANIAGISTAAHQLCSRKLKR